VHGGQPPEPPDPPEPPEPPDTPGHDLVCSKRGIQQRASSCFFVASMLLFVKIPYLYTRLDGVSRAYADSIRSQPIIDTAACTRLPRHVATEYGYEIDIQQHGGKTVALFRAMLSANAIQVVWVEHAGASLRISTHWPATCLLAVKWTMSHDVSPKRAMLSLNTAAVPGYQHLGGLLGLRRQRRAGKKKHPRHALAYTVCQGQVNLCNRGVCSTGLADLRLKKFKHCMYAVLVFRPL
jgi:hypothetical protein